MTDNEIIKGLECCGNEFSNCDECPYDNEGCVLMSGGASLMKDTLNLINRQKVEIEGLKADKIIAETREKAAEELLKDNARYIKTVKIVAIKEFAEKLRKNIPFITYCLGNVSDTIIDKLVKEMTGGEEE